MKRNICFGLVLILIAGIPLAFAQNNIELPEPVLADASIQRTKAFDGPAGLWYPYFDEIVYYLWNFDVNDQLETMDFLPRIILAQAATADAPVPVSIRNNRYFMESVRLTNLAQRAFEEGDYDASVNYSNEAIRYAVLSDEFVALQLKIKETNDTITAAQARLAWASSSAVDAPRRFPTEFNLAQNSFNEARDLRAREDYDGAILAARGVFNALALVTEIPPPPEPEPVVIVEEPPVPVEPELPVIVEQPVEPAPVAPVVVVETPVTPPPVVVAPPPVVVAPPPVVVAPPPPVTPAVYPLPAQYTVRPWATSKDCLWNIAGRPWAYNDPTQWRLIYNANRARMPQPDNPDLIHPGMVLDIPSIRGETREGMWVDGRNYQPLR